MFVAANEFTGVYKVSQNQFTAAELQLYINEAETDILVNLFGADLYKLFIADLDGNFVPQSARFIAVFNSFVEQATNSGNIFYVGSSFDPIVYPSVHGGSIPKNRKTNFVSYGIKDMLKGFIYNLYTADQDNQTTPTGNKTRENDASKTTGAFLRVQRATKSYNRAVQTYQAIQWYMTDEHKEDYPEFNGTATKQILFGGIV